MRFLWIKGVPLGLLFATGLLAQNGSRITRPVDEGSLTPLPRTTHSAIQTAGDLGRVAPDMPLERMQLMLASSPEQQTALDQLLREQQDTASPSYRQWLTPEQFGERFGASQQELDTVTGWLRGHGFRVERIANGRRSIEFSGTAGQVEQAFHTEIHRYSVNGEAHIANSTDLSIPAALAAVVTGVVSLHDFRSHAQHHLLSDYNARPLSPQYTNSFGEHSLTPSDFATIYDLSLVWSGLGIDGTGQKIAIVARSNINLADVTAFRSSYGLPPASVQVLVNGPDPGIPSFDEESEADLDVEWSGAVAKGATVVLVVSGSTATSDGVDLSSHYIVDHNVAPVVSMSFGSCEADNGSFNTYYNNLWQQAVAQGMSVFVSAGDNGSAGCDDPRSTSPAHQGFGVSGLASTPYNVAVGGSEFNENGNDLSYWSSTNAPGTFASVIGYIPEVVWNESTFVSNNDPGNGLWAGSGGVSIVHPTPFWQMGPGVPTSDPGTTDGHHRYLPDVSLTAADHDGYRIRQEGATYRISGTSASSPSFAGIMALINQYTNSRNGNPNPELYALAQSHPSVFHDVTSGSNAVPCSVGFLGCSGPSIALGIARMGGYNAGPGYDLATGLGSVDIYQLVTNWPAGSSGGGGGSGSGGSSSNPPPPGLVSLSGAHLATGGGWETLIELINPTGTIAATHLRIYDDQGKALSIPLSAPGAGINTTAAGLDPQLAPKSVLILQSAAPASGPVLLGSAEVTSDTRISGFLIFRWTVTGEEVLVPLSSSVASSYALAFDNTGGLATGIALASSSLQSATVGVVARDQNGLVVVPNGTIALPALGHKSFVVSTQFPALANQRGTLEFTPPANAQVSVVGIRATPSGAFTGIPILAGGANGSGSLADLASGGGWETLIELVNSSAAAAQAHLRFYADSGAQLALPVTSSDLGLNANTASVDATLPPGGSALISSTGATGSIQQNGSAQLTSDPGVTGFLIFQFTSTGQEVLVPAESGSAHAYVIAFDQTNGLTTGISLSNGTAQMANVFVTLRDQNGVTFAFSILTLAPLGHKAFVLTDLFPSAAGTYGTVEIDPPLGGQIGVVGIRATPGGAFTSVPVLAP